MSIYRLNRWNAPWNHGRNQAKSSTFCRGDWKTPWFSSSWSAEKSPGLLKTSMEILGKWKITKTYTKVSHIYIELSWEVIFISIYSRIQDNYMYWFVLICVDGVQYMCMYIYIYIFVCVYIYICMFLSDLKCIYTFVEWSKRVKTYQ